MSRVHVEHRFIVHIIVRTLIFAFIVHIIVRTLIHMYMLHIMVCMLNIVSVARQEGALVRQVVARRGP